MGLHSTISTESSAIQRTANSINSTIQSETTHQSTNALPHGTMAPALTEPLSQTNKLSSSASPRPSSNSLISSSSTDNSNHLNNINHSNLVDNFSTFASSNNKLLNQEKSLLNGNTVNGGSFQSAFEQFQQKQSNDTGDSVDNSQTTLSRKCSKSNVTTGRLRKFVNGRQLNNQMGPMCDTNSANINFDIENIDENQGPVEYEQEQHKESEEAVVVEEEEEEARAQKNPVEHMDSIICDKRNNDESQNNNHSSESSLDAKLQDSCNDSAVSKQTGNQSEEASGESNPEETNKSECDTNQELQTLDEIKHKTPPRTPNNSSNVTLQGQIQVTPASSLTPQSITSGMGLQKDFIKDAAEMDQVLGELGTSDMELLQVLKGFDTTPGGEGGFCELSLFTDVDVMNYEDVGIQQTKDSETKEVRSEIEKRQQLMQRKCDFLLRRLRKIQARYMGKHTSEEVAGLFEWGANPMLRRKEHQDSSDTAGTRALLSFDDDKRRQISTATMKAFVRRVSSAANAQHSSLVKRNKVGRPSNATLQAELTAAQNKVTTVPPVVPSITEKMTEEIAHVSGHLHTELKEIQSALDSDATASSSGGESADEMQPFNNTVQQPLSIAKRAAWKWARDRGAIASRWTWLLAQISDLEYRIRQHNELHHQIKKNKGAVTFEKQASTSSTTTTPTGSPVQQPSSVNGYRGVLPGNSKGFDVEAVISSTAIAPNGAYETNNSSGACRTRAFQRAGFRKRKLLQTANVHTVSKKAAKPSTVKCGCQWPLHPCALCTGRSDPTAPRDLPDTMTPSERVALLDPCFHPVLSFPEDVSHSIHFEATMRLPEWQNRVIRCSTKTSTSLKGSSVAVQKAAEREDRSKKFVDSRRKYNRKYPQEIMAANKLKNAKNRRALHGGQYNNNHHMKNKHRKLVASNSSGTGGGGGGGSSVGAGCISTSSHGAGSNNYGGLSSATSSTAGSDSMGLLNDNYDTSNGQLPRSKNASPTPGSYSSSSYKSERMDRRNRNSYDIDNIVIPYSVAAATRVEILPYKEIPTPKWRILDDPFELVSLKLDDTLAEDGVANKTDNENFDGDVSSMDISSNQLDGDHTEEDENEDISDEAIHIRHERALIDERKKFQTYLKYPWSTRSRANRRTDSRAESSGANTPDPSSPAPNTPSVAGDQESVPSPAAPSTPQTPLETIDENSVNQSGTIATPTNPILILNAPNSAARRVERKRTASGRKEREHSKDESGRSLTPDPKEIIPPYDPLDFPLPDDIYETMLKLMPNDHQLLEDCLKSNFCDGANEDKPTTRDKNNSIVTNNGDESITSNSSVSNSRQANTAIITTTSVNQNTTTTTIETQRHYIGNSIGSNNNQGVYATNMVLGYSSADNMIGEDSDTDSAESGIPDDDPNDPEWREPE